MFKSLFFFLLLLFSISSVAQELTDITEACPRTDIPFSAPTIPNAVGYDWDFCTGDLLLTPKADIIESFINDPNTPQNDAWRPEGMDVAFDGTNWYGFITNRSGNNIIRVNFGNSLDNIPEPNDYKNLGNPNGILAAPIGIKVIKVGGLWYAFVANYTSSGRLTRIDFGADLSNSSPIASNINGLGLYISQGIDIQKDGNDFYALITNFRNTPSGLIRRLTVVNFGSDITNITPTVTQTEFTFRTRLEYY